MQKGSVPQQRAAGGPQGEDPIPTYNNYIRSTLGKGESANYADQLQGLALIKNYDEKLSEVALRILSRLMQYGHFNIAGVQLALQLLQVEISRDEKALMRIVRYFVLLGLGDGAAGTPLPVPPQAGGSFLAKAVDRLSLEVLVAAWNDLGNEKATFVRKQAALRALAAVTRASLTSRPDDATYVQGLYETLRGLLDKVDALRAGRRGLAQIISQAQGNKKKNLMVDIRQRAEMWGLLRVAFSAARLALPRSGLYKVAQRSLSALASSDPVCARHALALASLVAKDPAGCGSFIAAVEPLLRKNVEAARRTGALHLGLLPPKRGGASVTGDGDSESHLNLRDTWARVYLARACAAVIQSGHIGGDVANRGAVFWQALLLLAVADPSERVALEAIRAMFGAPYPRATSAAAMRQPGAGARLPVSTNPADVEAESSQSKILGASWHLVMTQALEQPPVPEQNGAPGAAAAAAGGGGGDAAAASAPAPPAAAGGAAAAAGGGGPVGGAGLRAEDACVFGRVARRLLRLLQSRSHSLVCGAARAVAVLAEARAWFHALSGGHGHEAEPEVARRWMRSLHGFLLMLAGDDTVSGCERAAALEALVWSQGLDQPPTLSPGLMLRAAAYGGFTAPPIARYTFADPWPPCLLAELLGVLARRLRCSVGAPPELLLELAGALAAGSPAGMPREALQGLWDMAPGPVAARAALQLLSAPLPPLCLPPAGAAVEVKALACQAEVAFQGLKAMAACWLGEHINSVSGEYAWKSWEHKMGPSAAGQEAGQADGEAESGGDGWGRQGSTAEAAIARTASVTIGGAGAGALGPGAGEAVVRMAATAAAHNPLLAVGMAHLNRAVITGAPVVRIATAQALAKVAVRSGEPYRIQCYSLLAAAVGRAGSGASGVGGVVGWSVDPLGLAPVVGPALEVLDAMYAGELVLERQVAQHGTRAAGWPAPTLEALRRRHEWLLGAIAVAVCAVPRELFLPLGPRSRRLLFPNEKEDEEEEAARKAAAAQASQQAEPQYDEQQYDEYGQPYQYDYSTAEQYDYGDYYSTQQQDAEVTDPYGQQQDPLARYDFSGQKAAAAVELNWGGDQAGTYDNTDATSDAAAVADARPGVVLYTFTPETEDEVSVSAGDSVRVLADLGEWLQVVTAAGQQGLVPASYVQLLDEQQRQGGGGRPASPQPGGGLGLQPSLSSMGSAAGGLSSQASFGGRQQGDQQSPYYSYGGADQQGSGTDQAGADYYTYRYDNPEYDASNGSYYGDYGGGQYGSDYYGGGGGAYGSSTYDGGGGGGGMYGSEGGAGGRGGGKKGGFGGFDDFGAVLAEAKTAAAAARHQPPQQEPDRQEEQQQQQQQQQEPQEQQEPLLASGPSLVPGASISSTTAPAPASYMSAPSATLLSGPSAVSTAPAPTTYASAYSFAAGPSTTGALLSPVAPTSYASYSTLEPPSAVPSVSSPYGGAGDSWYGQGQGQTAAGNEAGTAPAASAEAQGVSRATAMYEFAAEMEGELSVAAGEELEVLGDEIDGWYNARVATDPSRQGLIPASYVQMLQ